MPTHGYVVRPMNVKQKHYASDVKWMFKHICTFLELESYLNTLNNQLCYRDILRIHQSYCFKSFISMYPWLLAQNGERNFARGSFPRDQVISLTRFGPIKWAATLFCSFQLLCRRTLETVIRRKQAYTCILSERNFHANHAIKKRNRMPSP